VRDSRLTPVGTRGQDLDRVVIHEVDLLAFGDDHETVEPGTNRVRVAGAISIPRIGAGQRRLNRAQLALSRNDPTAEYAKLKEATHRIGIDLDQEA
jgi:hypothetical protein